MILILAEQKKGKIQKGTFEVLEVARRLKEKWAVPCAALVFGSLDEKEAQMLGQGGAGTVYWAKHPQLDSFSDEAYGKIAARVVGEVKPAVVLGAATLQGRSWIPRVAALCRGGLAADCTELSVDEKGALRCVRPVFGGTILAEVNFTPGHPQFATVRRKIFPSVALQPSHKAQIKPVEAKPEELQSRAKVLESVEESGGEIQIADADIIVAGGRGMKGPEHFKILSDLAHVLGGAMGASRAAVDAGWVPYKHQIGQTGKTVKPKLYFACGISGAIQHMIGMQTADVIVAINKDPDCPMIKVANYSLIGDLFEIVPLLTQRFKEILNK